MPRVHEIVKNIFKKDPSRGVNPDEAVAMGAAIQVHFLGLFSLPHTLEFGLQYFGLHQRAIHMHMLFSSLSHAISDHSSDYEQRLLLL